MRLPPGRDLAILALGAAVVSALAINIGLAHWPYNAVKTADADYLDSFASQAVWEQVAEPHPEGLDCWVLADPETGQNSPQLLWCSEPGRGGDKRDKPDKSDSGKGNRGRND